jgi:hypothetical protein
MKTEKYKKLTQEEINLIKRSIIEFLKPDNVEVNIDDNPSIIYCTYQSDKIHEEYEQYLYDFTIKSGNNEFKDFFDMEIGQNLFEVGWLLAYYYFQKFDKNYHSEIGNNLWDNKKIIVERLKDEK